MKLRECLANSTLVDLKAIAERRGVKLRPNPLKAEVVDVLAAALGKPDSVTRVLADLSAEERQALEAVLAEGGRIPSYKLEREFGGVRRPEIYAYHDEAARQPWRHIATPSEGLWYRGLIFRTFDVVGNWRGDIYIVPDDLRPLLPTVEKKAPQFSLEAVPVPSNVLDGGDLRRDIFTLLAYLQRREVEPVRGDRLPKQDVVRLSDELTIKQDLSAVRNEEEAGRLAFVRRLADRAGLVQVLAGRLCPSPKTSDWLKMPRHKQIHELWTSYLQDEQWDELLRLPSIQLDRRVGYYRRPTATRQKLVEHLKQCPPEQWLSIESFVQSIKRMDPDFLRTPQDYNLWYMFDASGRNLQGYKSWDRVEGEFIRSIIRGPFHWLGLVALDDNRIGGVPTTFRLTAWGAWLLGLTAHAPAEPAHQPIVIQANFEVAVPYEADLLHVFQLERLAELVQRDRMSLYRLSKDSIRRNLEGGGKIADIIAFLEKASAQPLPQNVAYSLREWGGRYGEIEVHRAALLTVADALLLQELRANKRVGLRVRDELSPQAVTVDEGEVVGLVERLRKAGYLPRVGDELATAVGAKGRKGAPRHKLTLDESDLVPLLAAARVMRIMGAELGLGQPLQAPAAVLDRLESQLSYAALQTVQRLARQAEEAIAEALEELEEEEDDEDEEEESYYPPRPSVRFETSATRSVLEEAIQRQVAVDIEYYTESRGEMTRRRVDPYRLEQRSGTTYLVGYCHWRQAERVFRLDHIRSAELTNEPVQQR
jgi:hypothetical protein